MSKRADTITLDDRTGGQHTALTRILNVGARAGEARRRRRELMLKAIMTNLESAFEELEDTPALTELFVALESSASVTAAKRIAQHPARPEDVDRILAERWETDLEMESDPEAVH